MKSDGFGYELEDFDFPLNARHSLLARISEAPILNLPAVDVSHWPFASFRAPQDNVRD